MHQKHKKSTKKHLKHQKHKSTKTQPSRSTKRYKRTKTKNALKKHGKKVEKKGGELLIHLFAFLCFLCARRNENRKKKIEKIEMYPQDNVLKGNWEKEKSPHKVMY